MSFVSTSTGSFFNRSLAQMAELRGRIEQNRTQIATGLKFERGSEAPAAWLNYLRGGSAVNLRRA